MVSYLKNAPVGFPGDITRSDKSTVEPAMLVALTAVYAQRFGEAMRYVTGGIQQWTTGLTKADFKGVLVREVPSVSGSTASGFDDSVPRPEQVQGLLTSGYIAVKCTDGTPARGGIVYVRIVADTDRPIGAFEAAADGGNSVALDFQQASWASDGVDADGMAELRVQVP
jgi:hypothetical protein